METFIKFPWALSDEYREVVFMDEVNPKYDVLELVRIQNLNKGYLNFDPKG